MNRGDYIRLYTASYSIIEGYITGATPRAIELRGKWYPRKAILRKDNKLVLKKWFKQQKEG